MYVFALSGLIKIACCLSPPVMSLGLKYADSQRTSCIQYCKGAHTLIAHAWSWYINMHQISDYQALSQCSYVCHSCPTKFPYEQFRNYAMSFNFTEICLKYLTCVFIIFAFLCFFLMLFQWHTMCQKLCASIKYIFRSKTIQVLQKVKNKSTEQKSTH